MNKEINYIPFDKYILRTPYLTFNEVCDLNINKVRELCTDSSVSEAIYLASPELHQEMLKYLGRDHEDTDEKLVLSLFKYVVRMGTRCTPFGLFSGCSVGKIENKTNIVLSNVVDYKRVTRLDMNYLCALSQKLESNKEIRKELLYFPNTSLYTIGDEMRYVEYQYVNTDRKHYLMSIDSSDFIDEILEKSEDGITINELASFIVDTDISLDAATDFVHELIDSQILISSISPTVTGGDYFEVLRDEVKSKPIADKFNEIKEKLDSLDNKKGDNFLLYSEIEEIGSSLNIEVNRKYLFQTDLNVTFKENSLDSDIIEDIKDGVKILNKMASNLENKKLDHFKKKFHKRFEDEEVPLGLVLDVETGIGFGEEHENSDAFSISNLVDDISVKIPPARKKSNPVTKVATTKLSRLLLNKIVSGFDDKEKIIELKQEDFVDFEENWDEMPNTFSSLIKIFETDKAKPLIYFSNLGGTTAAILLSRFSHVDKDIYNFIEEILIKEKQKNVIFAEIVHLPQARVGNVLSRSNLRDYEIPYLAKSALPKERQLKVSDLMISLRNGRIVLRSKTKNKEVIPILSNAHNFEADPLPIYSFLAEIQAQNSRVYFGFDWGDILINQPYLPRVMYKNIIFSLATWNFKKEEFLKLNTIEQLKKWKEIKCIPDRIQIIDFDNNLFVDFKNELSCKMFLSVIKNKEFLTIKEYLFNEKKALINKEKKAVENEFIFSFYKEML
ncbi:lantibiotic dehydratase family protein [Flavobacterium collinsii]|uniref:Nisin biosynthesis protein NisB n=1 Tax=Flavobacterium collinsii TaxID=1114861 RepID=A0ABM8KGE2_9FLAO|nr:lantibiotic dehydratase family protein [Flavobacterium collinsii]CAA9195960.1 Nisin biosynthesis protein NisB [Flavobacterium collinsii]